MTSFDWKPTFEMSVSAAKCPCCRLQWYLFAYLPGLQFNTTLVPASACSICDGLISLRAGGISTFNSYSDSNSWPSLV